MGARNPSPVRRGAGERCRPLDLRNAEPTAAGGQGSPYPDNGRHLSLPSPYRRGFPAPWPGTFAPCDKPYPRPSHPTLFSPRSPRPRGLREASCGRGGCGVHGGRPSLAGRHGGAVDRQGRNWAGPSPCRDVGTTRDPQTTARGTVRRLLALLRHDIRHRHRHAAVDCDATPSRASPRIRLEEPETPRREPVGGFGAWFRRLDPAQRRAPAPLPPGPFQL